MFSSTSLACEFESRRLTRLFFLNFRSRLVIPPEVHTVTGSSMSSFSLPMQLHRAESKNRNDKGIKIFKTHLYRRKLFQFWHGAKSCGKTALKLQVMAVALTCFIDGGTYSIGTCWYCYQICPHSSKDIGRSH